MYAVPEARARREHQHAARAVAAHALRLADAAERAVVADDQRHRAAGLLGQRPAVVAVEVPAVEAGGHVGRVTEHAVAEVRPGNREADAAHLLPGDAVLRQVFADRFDPARDDRLAPLRRVGRPLLQLRRDGRAVGPHAAHLRHGGAAVGADEDLLAFVHRRSLATSVYDWRNSNGEILTSCRVRRDRPAGAVACRRRLRDPAPGLRPRHRHGHGRERPVGKVHDGTGRHPGRPRCLGRRRRW